MPGAWEVAAPAKPTPFVGSEGSSFTPAQIFARNAPYLKPGTANFWTKLNPNQESQFRTWVKDSHIEFDPNSKTPDYDMRGFWLALQRGDPRATGAVDPNDHKYHYPDYWKTPYDLTFSRESQWANKNAPRWNSKDQLVLPSGKVVFDDKHRRGYMKPQESEGGWEVAAAEKPAPLPAGPSPLHAGLEHIKSIYHSVEPGVKHNAKQLLGVFSSLADLATAVPGQVMTASAIVMEDLNQLLAGEEPKKAYKTGLETGEKVGGMFMNPVHRVLALLHQEKPYEASAPQKALDKFNSKVHDIAVEYEGATGGKFPAPAFEGIVQELFGILSAEGTTAGATRLVDKLDKISEARGKGKGATPPAAGGPAPKPGPTPEAVDKEFTDWSHGLTPENPPIKEAALKDKETGQILPQGERHDVKLKATGKYDAGFLDEEGNFLDRKQAEERARAAGQLKPGDKMFRPEEGLHSGDIFRKAKPRIKLHLTPKGAAAPTSLPLATAWSMKDLDRAASPSSTDLKDLTERVRKEGIKKPITVTVSKADNLAYVTDGNNRLAAAKELGLKEIPVKWDTTDVPFTEEQKTKAVPLEKLGLSKDSFPERTLTPEQEADRQEVLRLLGESQAGRISPEVLTGLASAGLGALAGAYVDDKNPIMGMIVGGTLGLWMVNGIRSMARGSADEAVAARSLMTNLTKLSGETMARQIMLIKYLKSHIPSDYLEHAKAIYAHLEDPSKPLSPRARELMDKYVKPIQKGNASIREALRKLGVDVGPDISGAYVHRIPKGQRSSIFEQLERAYPQHRGFSRQAPSLKPREAFALVSDTGDRVIAVMKGKNKFTAFRDGKPIWRGELKPRAKTLEAGGHTWTKEEATTPEIEQHTTLRYYHDALGTEIDNNLRLGRALDNAMFIEGLKQLPSLKDHAMPPGEAPPADWRTVSIPQLQGWHFSPRIADILSDFAGEGASHPAETLARAGRIMVSSLFWNPLPHILNILDHAVIQRGLSALVNPAAYWRGAQTAVQAWRDVSNLSPDYVKMVREGAGLMYPKVILRDFGEQALRAIGHQPEMTAVAKAWEYANPLEMVKRIYGFSRRNLWFWNDVIMMQAYHERAEIRGKSMPEVMRDVERHIPNYRIPDRVLGSHWIAQVLKSPAFIAFGRYDYARLASYGSMIKDLVGKGVPLRDRATALDQMAALAFTSIVVYPMVLDKVAQALTGNPNASVQRFGANTIPYLLYEYFEGKKDASGVVQSMFPETPITKLAQEWYSNRNMFSGSKLLESVHDVPHVVAQMFNPLYLTGQVYSGKLSPEQFMLQSLGVKSPTSEQLEHRREWRERERTEARRHEERRR